MIQTMTWIRPKSMADKAECEVCNRPTEIVLENLQGGTMFLWLNCTATAFSEHPRLMALAVAKLVSQCGPVELQY
jgi:hypothetical protein